MVLLALQFVAFQPAVQEILENYNTGKWLFCVKYLLKKRISCEMNAYAIPSIWAALSGL